VKKKRRAWLVLRKKFAHACAAPVRRTESSPHYGRKFMLQTAGLLVTPTSTSMKRAFLLSAAAFWLAGPILAETPDAAPVDVRQLLEVLKQVKDQNEVGLKSRRSNAYQQVAAAAASNERAVAFWKEAVKTVQFEGAKQEGSQIRDWREGDGEALNDRLCANAVRLHLNWLALHLQHASGAETKTLLPKVIEHASAAMAAHEAAEQFADNLQKAKERNPGSPGARKNVQEDSIVKRVHDQIMRLSVSNGPVSRWMQLGDLLDKGKDAGSWEPVAGNADGIYTSVIMPEFRATKDPRLLEYWDMMLKREGERAAKRQLDIEQREWNTVKRPAILWERAQDVMLLGQRNRALGEMINILKTYPQHPSTPKWIGQLEALVVPAAVTPPGAATPPVPAVPAPAVVPSAAAVPPAASARAAGTGLPR
jgi:hypothetical protein